MLVTVAPAPEGGSATVTLTLSAQATSAITFQIGHATVSCGDGTNNTVVCPANTTAASAADYTTPPSSVTFSTGLGNTVRTVNIPLVDDADIEGAEVFGVSVSGFSNTTATLGSANSSSGYTSSGVNYFFVRINDNDPTVTIERGATPVTEGTAATFTVRRNAPQTTALTVNLTVSEDTTDGQDFVASGDEGAKTWTSRPTRTW